VILIDTPPILDLQDARLIGRITDGASLVVRAGHTTFEQVSACHARMRKDHLPLLGTILNDWKPAHSLYGYQTRYGKYGDYYQNLDR
jgi:Mrp family chromosome partitioning ATPase